MAELPTVCNSYGIACFYENKLLFGERPFTYAFMEWISHVIDREYTYEMLCCEVDKMMEVEKQYCYRLPVECLYTLTRCHNMDKKDHKINIFNQYNIKIAQTSPNGKTKLLDYIKDKSPYAYRTEQFKFDIPKGRKKPQNKRAETDQGCALREFREETGKCVSVALLPDIPPFIYQFTDCGVHYVYTWFLAETTDDVHKQIINMQTACIVGNGPKKNACSFRHGQEFVNLHLLTYEQVSNMINIHSNAYKSVFDQYLKYKLECN